MRQLLAKRGIHLGPPTTEELVALFLREHGLTRAAHCTGTAGAGGRLRHRGQRSIHQDWTYWKQWALAHADWPAFWERMMARQADEEVRARRYINSSEFRDDYNNLLLEEGRRERRRRTGRVMKLAVVALAAIGATIGVVVETADRRAPESLQQKRI